MFDFGKGAERAQGISSPQSSRKPSLPLINSHPKGCRHGEQEEAQEGEEGFEKEGHVMF
jgi:hypothetical protein